MYLETAPGVVDYLALHSEVKFVPYVRHPDYLANRPGATVGGRPLAPLPFDGRLLGADFDLVRPPLGEFMALGGMMIGRDDIEPLARPFGSRAALRDASALLWRHATDRLRFRRGLGELGDLVVARPGGRRPEGKHVLACDVGVQGLQLGGADEKCWPSTVTHSAKWAAWEGSPPSGCGPRPTADCSSWQPT